MFQPRDRNLGSLSSRLHAATKNQGFAHDPDVLKLQSDLKSILAQEPLIISEEMFLVSERGISWRTKIRRLRLMLGPISCTLIVTLRNPIQALPSYYREIFRSLPILHRLSFRLFCVSDRALVFDYLALGKHIRNCGFSSINYVDMRLLAAGAISLTALTGDRNAFQEESILGIGVTNKDAMAKPGKRVLPSVPVIPTRLTNFVLKAFSALGSRPGMIEFMRSCLAERFVLKAAGERNLITPARLTSRLSEAYQFLLSLHQ